MMDAEQEFVQDPPRKDRTPFILALALGGIVLVAIVIGFTTGGGGRRQYDRIGADANTVDHLELAIDALKQRSTTGASTGLTRAVSYLNQWSDEQKLAEKSWQAEPLTKKLPGDLRIDRLQELLGMPAFIPADLSYLQEAAWAREITRWVTPQPANPDLEPWLKKLEETAGPDVRLQVNAAERLFDWTICNVALDAFPPEPKAAVASAGDSPDSFAPSMRGIPGPGYTRLPQLSLLTGRGDAWERSRVFIALCRQAGIEVVMLGTPGTTLADSKAWISAALIGGKLYLFDAELGLPIPDADGGIATLDEVVADPKLLRALDLEGIGRYPIGEKELNDIVALIDSPLYGMSKRMQALEGSLRGDRRLKLAAFAADLPQRLEQTKHVKHVVLWRVSVDAVMFDETSQLLRSRDPAAQLAYQLQFNMYLRPTPLRQAREAYFRGDFSLEPPRRGARELYLAVRPPDAELRRLAIAGDAWMFFGLREPPKSPAETQRLNDQYVSLLRRGKEDATYFLGVCQFEEGAFDLSREWFEKVLIEKAADSPWVGPGRYMLGRSYESLNEWEKAREQYLTDQSPQRYGNILRASAIRRKHKS